MDNFDGTMAAIAALNELGGDTARLREKLEPIAEQWPHRLAQNFTATFIDALLDHGVPSSRAQAIGGQIADFMRENRKSLDLAQHHLRLIDDQAGQLIELLKSASREAVNARRVRSDFTV